MSVKEILYELPMGTIAAKIWHEGKGTPILALHGWLDNAASFDLLAPLLNQHIIAIDLPGHGLSSHKPPHTVIHFIDMVIDVIQIIEALGLNKCILLGHSLGAAIASLVAGVIPEKLTSVVVIDGLGPLTLPAYQAPNQLKYFIDEINTIKILPEYISQEEALLARLKVNHIQKEAAALIVNRGLKQLENKLWTWRTDPRLLIPSAMLLTEEQTLAFLQNITCPICLIRPEPGYPYPQELIQKRIDALKENKDVKIFRLEGHHHHVHLDNPEKVAVCLHSFFNRLI